MTPEEREMMHFILRCQSEAAADNLAEKLAAKERFREMDALHKQHSAELKILKAATHDLLKVARMHSRRLDRLDGLSS